MANIAPRINELYLSFDKHNIEVSIIIWLSKTQTSLSFHRVDAPVISLAKWKRGCFQNESRTPKPTTDSAAIRMECHLSKFSHASKCYVTFLFMTLWMVEREYKEKLSSLKNKWLPKFAFVHIACTLRTVLTTSSTCRERNSVPTIKKHQFPFCFYTAFAPMNVMYRPQTKSVIKLRFVVAAACYCYRAKNVVFFLISKSISFLQRGLRPEGERFTISSPNFNAIVDST